MLIGYIVLCNNYMDDLFCLVNEMEIVGMCVQLCDVLCQGVLGFSIGLVYVSVFQLIIEEVMVLVEELVVGKGVYIIYLCLEFELIFEVLDEVFCIGCYGNVLVVVLYYKCVGVKNWGCIKEMLVFFDEMCQQQDIVCDCYFYLVSLLMLDMKQVIDEFDIVIIWFEVQLEQVGKMLQQIVDEWQVSLYDVVVWLMLVGVIYYNMDEQDVWWVMCYLVIMIGFDGLLNDLMLYLCLWGVFLWVFGYYSCDEQLFLLIIVVYKMIGLLVVCFQLVDCGLVKIGYFVDLVLFDLQMVCDVVSFFDLK